MSIYDAQYFDCAIDRRGTDSEKWDNLPAPDVLPLFVADMDFPSPDCVRDALLRRAAHASYGYTMETDADFEAVRRWMRARHGLHVARESMTFMPSVVKALHSCVGALTDPGDSVIIQPPVYGSFRGAIEGQGRVLRPNMLRQTPEGWRMDFEDLEDAMRAGAKLMILCSPHNPVGRVWTREELTQLLTMAGRYGATIISDEIHADFVYEGFRHVPLLSLPGGEAHVQLISATKTFNLAGLHMCTMIAPAADTRARVERTAGNTGAYGGNNPFGQVAQRAAYTDGAPWLEGLLAYLSGNRDLVYEFIKTRMPRVRVSRLEGTYLMWLDMRDSDMPPERINAALMDKARVWLSDGHWFTGVEHGFQRINIACPRARLQTALERVAQALYPSA